MIHSTHTAQQSAIPAHDQTLIWSLLMLLCLGIVMVYSASVAVAELKFAGHGSVHYLIRHGFNLAFGLSLGFVALLIPISVWQKYATGLLLLSIVLLTLVLLPGIGASVNGSQRWLDLSVARLQPSEFVKLFMVIYAADYVTRKTEWLDSLSKGFLPILAAISIIGVLLLLEPDFGAFAVIATVMLIVLFLGGMSLKIFSGLLGLAAVGFTLLIWLEPYRLERIKGFLDPWENAYGSGYQLSQSLIAFGRGEWFGVGLGESVEKLHYLPEAHTDFVFAVLAEELGFVGVLAVILLYMWVLARAFMIGRQAAKLESNFAALVAQGIGVWIGMQALINMGVNMGMLPTKGLTLPLMSFGGSSLAASCMALAVLLRIDWENRKKLQGKKL